MSLDISTGRCPTKKQDCDCSTFCAILYGQEARRLKQEADNASPSDKELKHKQWQRFTQKYIKRGR